MHFSDAPPRRASDFPLSTKRIYIYKVATILGGRKHLKSRHAEWRASENCIWSITYSFKKVIRLHFPRCRLRDPSKIPIIPKGKAMDLTFREKISACETIDFPLGIISILRPRGGDNAKSAK